MPYIGVGPESGEVIEYSQALKYALERIRNGSPEEQKDFVEWYYSGNHYKEEDEWQK